MKDRMDYLFKAIFVGAEALVFEGWCKAKHPDIFREFEKDQEKKKYERVR